MSTNGKDQGNGQGQDRVTIRQLPTGVPGLDEILGGGLPEYSFNILAGAPGCGKTTLALVREAWPVISLTESRSITEID